MLIENIIRNETLKRVAEVTSVNQQRLNKLIDSHTFTVRCMLLEISKLLEGANIPTSTESTRRFAKEWEMNTKELYEEGWTKLEIAAASVFHEGYLIPDDE